VKVPEDTYEFNIEQFRNQKVAIFVSGPGYLEYPWAYETAILLKQNGAEVTVFDLSQIAEMYAMRLFIKNWRSPYFVRRLLRKFFLIKTSRIDLKFHELLEFNEIKCEKTKFKYLDYIILKKKYKTKNQRIGNLKSLVINDLPIYEILLTAFANFEKAFLSDEYVVDKNFARDILIAVSKVYSDIELSKFINFTSIFIANGRQPVQATLYNIFKGIGVQVILYEASGGFIFPKLFERRIDYWLTNPLNPIENYSKVRNMEKLSLPDDYFNQIMNLIQNRNLVPYNIDFLKNASTNLKIEKNTEGRNFVYFASSEWEISVIDRTENRKNWSTTFKNQIEAIKSILKYMNSSDKLYIRLHPSDPGRTAYDEAFWINLPKDNRIKVIPANSNIDSYALAYESDLSFAWISFIAIELCLRNLKIAVLGEPIYGPNFQDCWLKDEHELSIWLNNPKKLNPNNLNNYFKYLTHGGYPIKHSHITDDRKIFLQGEQVDLPRINWNNKIIKAIS
jgi:hypothetical protein